MVILSDMRDETNNQANTETWGITLSDILKLGGVQSWSDDETGAFADALAGMYC